MHRTARSSDVTTPTDSNRELLTVIASMRAKAGREQELREMLEALVEPTLVEQGCVNYCLHQGADDPAVFYFYENWTSPAELGAHMNTPHLTDFAGKVGDIADGPVIIQQLRRIA
jgi:quinol monooxygenase YgiN